MRENLLQQRVAFEGDTVGEQPIHRATKAVNIGAMIGAARVVRLLGGHIVDGPHHLPCLGQSFAVILRTQRALQSREAHIENLHDT